MYSEQTELVLRKLALRINTKIDKSEYYLSYSGGRDSHFLWWVIKVYMQDTQIPVVGVNTFREHVEIRERIYKHCDVVLKPTKTFDEIARDYGQPVFTKNQDEFIHRYQKGSRARSTLSRVYGEEKSSFNINNQARKLLLAGELPKVSPKCCTFTKKEPLEIYQKETGRKPIMGVRQSEGILRKAQYHTCLNKNGKFTPMYDITNEQIHLVEKECGIEVPEVYKYIERTGCIGCPYSRNVIQDLEQATPNQRNFAINSFKKAYEIKGIDYKGVNPNVK